MGRFRDLFAVIHNKVRNVDATQQKKKMENLKLTIKRLKFLLLKQDQILVYIVNFSFTLDYEEQKSPYLDQS